LIVTLWNLAEKHVKPGMEVWDIGSNVGVFVIASAQLATGGRVFAFEPDTFLVEVIRKSISAGDFRNMDVLPIAISQNDGFEEFHVAERGRASNALASAGGRSQMGGTRSRFLVPTMSGDSFCDAVNGRPDFIKIDVEGAEEMVLNGMQKTLCECRPDIYVEVGHDTKREVWKLLEGLGYTANQSIDNLKSSIMCCLQRKGRPIALEGLRQLRQTGAAIR
jgi:FkbM family methyltransferase